MTRTFPIVAELADSPCSVADCLEAASVMGRACVEIEPAAQAQPDFAQVTLGLPLCIDHAQLLRQGCRLETFSSGI
jgi:hypothetical protein